MYWCLSGSPRRQPDDLFRPSRWIARYFGGGIGKALTDSGVRGSWSSGGSRSGGRFLEIRRQLGYRSRIWSAMSGTDVVSSSALFGVNWSDVGLHLREWGPRQSETAWIEGGEEGFAAMRPGNCTTRLSFSIGVDRQTVTLFQSSKQWSWKHTAQEVAAFGGDGDCGR